MHRLISFGTAALLSIVCLVSLPMDAQAFSPGLTHHVIKPTISSNVNSKSRSQLWVSPTSTNSNSDDELKRMKSIIDLEDAAVDKSSTTSGFSNFRRNIGYSAAGAALIAAAAFANPSASFALESTAITSATSTASTLMEKLSETGFYQAFSLVFVSEIGDKTFFIAGLLAMKAGRLVSLVGSIGALAVMTVISVLIGQIFHAVPPGITQGLPLDDIAAVLAFAFFGLKTLKDASEIEEGGESGIDEEYADAEEAVEGSRTVKEVTAWGKIISTFGLVFAAEFGDRSFISTIALSAAQNPVSVAVGAIAAHAIATGIAVAGGSYVAKYISEKVIGYIGGTLFLVFAITTALGVF